MNEDEQHEQAFGEDSFISSNCREDITHIKNNDPDVINFTIRPYDGREVTGLAWRLLGRYIANNAHLKDISLDRCELTDEQIISLFSGLRSSTSLGWLDLDKNEFGIDGVRCMLPFLQNSPHLSTLFMGSNTNINTECFEVLVSALDGKSIEELHLYHCNITDISALNTCNLPNLRILGLADNNIGREGCIVLSNMLQKEDTMLEALYLESTGIDDQGVEIIATSLKHNTKLKTMNLSNNSITEKGHWAFLKLLVDVSSIENTYYKSNHALTKVRFTSLTTKCEHTNSALQLNEVYKISPHTIGREKVIKYQLNSQTRKELCESQDIEYSAGSIFTDIEPLLLPRILALIGVRHGQSELYDALVQTAPELLSYIDRKALLRDEKDRNEVLRARIVVQMKELTRQLADLEDEDSQLNNRLALIELGDSIQATVDGGKGGSSGEKRQRIN